MIQTPINIWLSKLTLLIEEVSDNNQEIKNKCIDFMQKINTKELSIAFTGHFSAGKSSLMNDLFGMSLLPTSPIPTSANVVKVKHGTDKIQFRYVDGSMKQVVGAYTEEAFQALCKDGDRAIEVMIERTDVPLPPQVAIVDTPGVDSTDEAHRLATEANLHIADVIFYMMDYNHVQAEGNLQFVKELTKRGKKVYLIINQIDKHREEEISFAAFQQGVISSFSAWDITLSGVFYTSLKQKNHPHNDLLQVKKLLQELYVHKEKLMEQNIENEVRYLIDQYIQTKQAAFPSTTSVSAEQKLTQEKYDSLQNQLHQWETEQKQISDTLLKDLDHILKNAYLMPANLREQAKEYLESMQDAFKVGLFFAKQKTEQERLKRENLFFHALQETIATQLTGHIEELVLEHAKKHHIFQDSLADNLQQHIPKITTDLLRKTIKNGAGISGNYVLTYTNDIVEAIKSLYRGYVRKYLTDNLPELETNLRQKVQDGNRQTQQYRTQLEKFQQVIEQHKAIVSEKQHLMQLLESEPTEVSEQSIEKLLQTQRIIQQATLTLEQASPVVETALALESNEDQPVTSNQNLQLLQKSEEIMYALPSLRSFYEQLKTKRELMQKQQFTVALFGAFSAGKSSFANALLGKSLLPVSPNPTTATVCRICPPNEEHADQSATVTFKSTETLHQELQHLFQLFDRQTDQLDIHTCIRDIPIVLELPLETTRQKLAIPFLRAIANGYQEHSDLFGKTIVMQQSDAIAYMANEAKSAFVEEVSLYLDSKLAKLGITLVDTPGADSLHARHTDVAFRYMKQADALLFVTYYNHAFSRADRELLIQLGRVQDSFALDKMYFIVNAADLAASSEELDHVVSYVATQLNQYGIRNPRLFPVSSLLSLDDKLTDRALNPAFAKLEKAFFTFIQEDSRAATIARMTKTVEQAIDWLNTMLTNLQKSETDKQAQQLQWSQAKEKLSQVFQHLTSTSEERSLTQEIKTLLYYVGDRVRLRYYDEFPVYINPSAVRESGKIGRKQLTTASKELLAFIGNDLVQEFRATSLRIEKYVNQTILDYTEQQNILHQSNLYGLTLAALDQTEWAELTWTYPTWDEKDPSFQKAVAIYKNNAAFFEQNGRDRMKEQLKSYLDASIAVQIEQTSIQLIDFYIQAWQQIRNEASAIWIKQVIDHFDQLASSLQEKIEEQPLFEAKENLAALLQEIN